MTEAGDVVLAVDELRMRYGATDVLRGVAFRARCGEVLAVLGPNGAGKTTTIEVLEGFRVPSAGRVAVLGVDPARGDERWRARVGVVHDRLDRARVRAVPGAWRGPRRPADPEGVVGGHLPGHRARGRGARRLAPGGGGGLMGPT